MPDPQTQAGRQISADTLLKRIPTLAVSGEDSAVDLILFETLKLLVERVMADIGQITLLPLGGHLEKLCILKDGKPWEKRIRMPRFYDFSMGFTGRVLATGESVLVEDIWAPGTAQMSNPFLELMPALDREYVAEIKKPVASSIILPIKHDEEVFCTLELSRYRNRAVFTQSEKEILDDFTRRYGTLIIDYVLDIKSRVSVNTASRKLLNMARLIASSRPVDYREVVEPYVRLSSADAGMAWFKTGGIRDMSYRMILWQEDEIREVLLNDFMPSEGSILRDSDISIFPVEEDESAPRLSNFRDRITHFAGISEEELIFILGMIGKVKSYVIYPLHLLGQEMGAIALASFRPRFWKFLHMSPFLSLYNSLLKSFLLNERVIQYLWEISLKIHNPGFYCLGALKGEIVRAVPSLLTTNPKAASALLGMEKLFAELHDYGKIIRWRNKEINLEKWLQAFLQRKAGQFPMLKINFNLQVGIEKDFFIFASDEQLETIFENLFANSVRAINTRQSTECLLTGKIDIAARLNDGAIEINVRDNGAKYPQVSGRGVRQITEEMRNLKGTVSIENEPYRTLLIFPNARKNVK